MTTPENQQSSCRSYLASMWKIASAEITHSTCQEAFIFQPQGLGCYGDAMGTSDTIVAMQLPPLNGVYTVWSWTKISPFPPLRKRKVVFDNNFSSTCFFCNHSCKKTKLAIQKPSPLLIVFHIFSPPAENPQFHKTQGSGLGELVGKAKPVAIRNRRFNPLTLGENNTQKLQQNQRKLRLFRKVTYCKSQFITVHLGVDWKTTLLPLGLTTSIFG